jgi:predicted signal transduction protein with EAL and GGDEF domain
VVVGASVGIALSPHDGTAPEQFLKNADIALYRAKYDGRGTYRFFEKGRLGPAGTRTLLGCALQRRCLPSDLSAEGAALAAGEADVSPKAWGLGCTCLKVPRR